MTNHPPQQNLIQEKTRKLHLKHKLFAGAVAFLAAVVVMPFTISAQNISDVSTTPQFILPDGAFYIPKTDAASVVIYDIGTDTFIYEKNATAVRSLASITKVLTGMVAEDIVLQQKNQMKTITLKKIIPETIQDRNLNVGEQWNFNQLLRYMLTTSSNTAAESIGGQLIPYSSFISVMNFKARTLGLDSIKIFNTSGLPIDSKVGNKTIETPGAIGSAKDVALLLAEEYKSYPELLTYSANYNATFFSTLKGKKIIHLATSTNDLLMTIPNIIGGKTGYTEASGGNLAIILGAPESRPVVIVVLGSTVEGRFNDTAALASSTMDYFRFR